MTLTQQLTFLLFSLTIPCTSALPHPRPPRTYPPRDLPWYTSELNLLTSLTPRLTGSPNHNTLISHIEAQVHALGLTTSSNTYTFPYYDGPTTPPLLSINDTPVPVPFHVPYSGFTSPSGISAPLITLNASSPDFDWSAANSHIAIIPLTVGPPDATPLTVWPNSPPWPDRPAVPASVANTAVNLTGALEAGVKGVIYAWTDVTSANALNQYGPFKMSYAGVPAVYTAGATTAQVLDAARRGDEARITLTGELIPDTPTKVFWTVMPGTEPSLGNESVILATHTDGTNVVQENGYITLLAMARKLAVQPPRRTHVLVFLTGHLHTPAVTRTGRVLWRWLGDNPGLWRGDEGQMSAVFGSCVEHLGAMAWRENLTADTYFPTGVPDDEMLFAATPELAGLVRDQWRGATGESGLRISNPIESELEQPGEGLPLLWENIPEVSLVTSPEWTLKIWPEGVDERTLIDVEVAKRQIESFLRVWNAVDEMEKGSFGDVVYDRGPM